MSEQLPFRAIRPFIEEQLLATNHVSSHLVEDFVWDRINSLLMSGRVITKSYLRNAVRLAIYSAVRESKRSVEYLEAYTYEDDHPVASALVSPDTGVLVQATCDFEALKAHLESDELALLEYYETADKMFDAPAIDRFFPTGKSRRYWFTKLKTRLVRKIRKHYFCEGWVAS